MQIIESLKSDVDKLKKEFQCCQRQLEEKNDEGDWEIKLECYQRQLEEKNKEIFEAHAVSD